MHGHNRETEKRLEIAAGRNVMRKHNLKMGVLCRSTTYRWPDIRTLLDIRQAPHRGVHASAAARGPTEPQDSRSGHRKCRAATDRRSPTGQAESAASAAV